MIWNLSRYFYIHKAHTENRTLFSTLPKLCNYHYTIWAKLEQNGGMNSTKGMTL